MNRLLFLSGLLTSALSFAQDPTPAPGSGPGLRVAVVPFAALSGEVPARAGHKAAGMLASELKNADGVQLIDPKKSTVPDPHAAGIAQSRAAVEAAKGQRTQRKFRLAEESLQGAVTLYRTHAAGLTDAAELIDALALLSAVQFNTGRDEEGQKSLTAALTLAPARDLPLAATSPLFKRVVEETRKAVQALPRGELKVESTPAGAAVSVDGVPLGSTPLVVKEIPAGQHLWRVALPSGEAAGGTLEIAGGKSAKVNAAGTVKDPESKIVAALSLNQLDAELISAAKAHAAATQADALILGALSREGKGLGADSFLFSAQSGELRRLPRMAFDNELLSAGLELFNLVTQIKERGAKVGEAVGKLPSPVSPGLSGGGARLAEAKYGVQLKEETAEEATPAAATPTPEAPKRRAPLKKK
jgi:hypothetical protein